MEYSPLERLRQQRPSFRNPDGQHVGWRIAYIISPILLLILLLEFVTIATGRLQGLTNRGFPYEGFQWTQPFPDWSWAKVLVPSTAGSPSVTDVIQDLQSGYPYLNVTQSERLQEIFRGASVSTFCEGRYGSVLRTTTHDNPGFYYPEFFSVVSALTIAFCGGFMLFTWQLTGGPSRYIKVVASLFLINGVFSALAHFTGLNRFLLADGKSMMLAAWLCFIFVLDEYIDLMLRVELVSATSSPIVRAMLRNPDVVTNWASGLAIFAYFTTTEVIECGAIGMVIPLACSAALGIFIFIYGAIPQRDLSDLTSVPGLGLTQQGLGQLIATHQRLDCKYIDPHVEKKARRHFFFGILLALVGVLLWIGVELACDWPGLVGRIMRTLPGHAVWHMACALGLTHSLAYGVVMHADNVRMRVLFVPSSEEEAATDSEGRVYWPYEEGTSLLCHIARVLTLGVGLPMIRFERPSSTSMKTAPQQAETSNVFTEEQLHGYT